MLNVCVFVDEHAGIGLLLQTATWSLNKPFASNDPSPVMLPHPIVGGVKLSLTTTPESPTPNGAGAPGNVWALWRRGLINTCTNLECHCSVSRKILGKVWGKMLSSGSR